MSPDSNQPPTPLPYDAQTIEPEPGSVLVDHLEETWLVILGHKVPISPSLADFGPVYTTGYLVTRGALDALDRLPCIQASLVVCPGAWVSGAENSVLREVLTAWRGLSVLDWGISRGCPWHLAAVERGTIGLGEIL